ncbi:MAG: hypothetical protein U0Z26_04340 [Anaerolineales bacterium]
MPSIPTDGNENKKRFRSERKALHTQPMPVNTPNQMQPRIIVRCKAVLLESEQEKV